jgi:histidinol-phosphatase
MSQSGDLAFALHLADLAAAVTLPAFGPRQPVAHKADHTPVTELDRAAEAIIRAAVRETFPDDGVLGEEQGLDAGTSGRVWVVDPIDGTRMFAEGIPMWTTLIGLREPTGITVGVADAPALRERTSAVRGEGAWTNGRRLQVSRIAELSEAFVLHAALEEFVASDEVHGLLRLVRSARGSRGMGDAWGHLLVARGAAEAVVEAAPCFEWDWAATSLIVEEAGGSMGSLEGGRPTDGCRLVVDNGLLADAVRAELSAGPA